MEGALQAKYRYSTWKSFSHRHQYMIARFSSSTKVNCFANRTMSYTAGTCTRRKNTTSINRKKNCTDFTPPPVLTSPLQKDKKTPLSHLRFPPFLSARGRVRRRRVLPIFPRPYPQRQGFEAMPLEDAPQVLADPYRIASELILFEAILSPPDDAVSKNL